ncbi:MAG TPA: isoprenylcysteine carboxylmethyltransferase family protein [Magnetospirillaceae bacterium]|nr:isoprenylcysteine carboxylmethyltransferase family protein [Magnetospirillaceae bacterium]
MILAFKNLLFTLIVPGTVAVYVPLRIAGDRSFATGAAFGAGCILHIVGASIYAWCVWDFATFGRGTPAPIDAPKKLVVRGLYRYTRNPMYTGVLTVIFAWALLFRAFELVLYALVVGTCFHLFIVLYEEPHLRAEFGCEYEDYRKRVGRWLPRLQPRQAV